MNTPITKITVSSFIYFSEYDQAEMCICAECAAANPQLNPKPISFTYDIKSDAFVSLCHYCDMPIIDIS